MQPYDSLEKDQHKIASFAEKKSSMNMEWCSLYGASMVPVVGMLRINKWFNRDKNETRLFLGWQPKEKKTKKDKALNLIKILRLLVNNILLHFTVFLFLEHFYKQIRWSSCPEVF